MKICFIITGLGIGGAEIQICDLADRFAISGNLVKILVLSGSAEVKPNNSQVSLYLLNIKKKPLDLLRGYFEARCQLKLFNPDVVHSHMIHANIFARLLRLSVFMKRLVCTAHSTNEGGSIRMFLYRITDWLADITTNVSDEAVKCYIGKKAARKNKIIVMYNGVDTNKFKYVYDKQNLIRNSLNISQDLKIVLAVARLTEAKDFPTLLNAFSLLLLKNSGCVLIIVGGGPLEKILKKHSEELNIANKVIWLGIRKDIAELMSCADIFVLSSIYEGFGLVVAEAMACERVVVATDCGGVAEIMGDIMPLVPIKNHIELAESLFNALSLSKEQRELIGKKARLQIINRFSIDHIAKQWLSVYNGG